jgi:xylulokinase
MLAAGVLEPGMMLDSSGTVEGMWFPLAEPLLREDLRQAGYAHELHVVPGLYLISGSVMTSGALLDWARGLLRFESVAEMADAAAEVAPGAGGVTILPHFRGSTTPISDPHSRGAIVGLTLATTRAEIARAAMEAVAFEMRTNLEFLGPYLPCPLTTIRGIGGGARSDVWLQIKADVLGHPIERPAVTEGTALGAALLAGVGVGIYADHRAAGDLVPVERTFEPDAEAHERYGEIHERVYRRLYPPLRRIA